MTLQELKQEIAKYQYFENTGVIDVTLAATLATQLHLGDPVWLVIIGASSGGKSQILRPVSMINKKFIHRIDDLTENTFLSGMAVTKAQKGRGSAGNSLLHRIGKEGIIVISDLTVLFSKNSEARNAILSQFRMLYDGEMIKHSGTSDEPISWKGKLGVLSGSTPTIYQHFEEVSDMGERFIYYRMEEYDPYRAAQLAVNRGVRAGDIDDILSAAYTEYMKGVVGWATESGAAGDIKLADDMQKWIVDVSIFAERVRTSVHTDWRGENIDRVPVTAYPTRVVLQLRALALALKIMRLHGGAEDTETDKKIVGRCAYSLANEEKRAVLKILAGMGFGVPVKTTWVADKIGLNTSIIGRVLQGMAATHLVRRSGDTDGLSWWIADRKDWEAIRYLEGIVEISTETGRSASAEESEEIDEGGNIAFDIFGK